MTLTLRDPMRTRLACTVLMLTLLAGCIPNGSDRRAVQPVYGGGGAYDTRPDDDVRILPAPPPAWEARRVVADARTVASSTYTVAPGDSLRAIGERTGAGSETIARANGLTAPFTIVPGQRLTIPGGRYHLVRSGETGIAIARAYGVDWSRIVSANGLTEPYILRVGQRVLLPGGGATSAAGGAPRTAAERAAAFNLDIDDIVTGGEPALGSDDRLARPTRSATRVLPATAAVAAPARLIGGFAWPVHGNILKRFGPGASGERSDGIKIAVAQDTPILAAADGVVVYVGSSVPSLGGVVILKHGDSWTTVYGHAGQIVVQRGQSVKRGQMIALAGDSGIVDRPQVHFEMRQGRTPVDPLTRLPAER